MSSQKVRQHCFLRNLFFVLTKDILDSILQSWHVDSAKGVVERGWCRYVVETTVNSAGRGRNCIMNVAEHK
jgi:hypothetical protein